MHLGSAKIAYANWDLKGTFILRVDDTNPGHSYALDGILADLKWLGINPDLMIRSSGNCDYHHALLNKLLADGKAYRLDSGAIALYPPTGDLSWDDLYLGTITFKASDVFATPLLLARSDGTPLYHFASVADDIFLNVTHIVRGADHTANTPKHLAIYDALGAPRPFFGHLPLLLDRDGAKLSKSGSHPFSLKRLKAIGILPDAVRDFLSSTGTASNCRADMAILRSFNRKAMGRLDPRTLAAMAGYPGSFAADLTRLTHYDSLLDLRDFLAAVFAHTPDFAAYHAATHCRDKRLALTGLTYGPDLNAISTVYRNYFGLT